MHCFVLHFPAAMIIRTNVISVSLLEKDAV